MLILLSNCISHLKFNLVQKFFRDRDCSILYSYQKVKLGGMLCQHAIMCCSFDNHDRIRNNNKEQRFKLTLNCGLSYRK